jgi:CRISPR-associated protein (TIGR02584 family)
LFLVGLSPAVVTETLYALAVTHRPRVLLDELHLVTTQPGLALATAKLLGRDGAIERLRREYGFRPGAFKLRPDYVHVLTDARDEPLEDIVSSEDSEAVGDQLAWLVREFTRRDDVTLHCSLAGGRKTMGALLAAALQVHGRPWDRLYHVLVSPPFEHVPEFFFPTRRRQRYPWNGGSVDARRARVSVAEIPVMGLGPAVRRLGLSELRLVEVAREIQAEANGRLRPEPLRIDLTARTVRIGHREVALPPIQLGLYLLYARTRMKCRRPACLAGDRCETCQLWDKELSDRREELADLCLKLRLAGYAASGPAALSTTATQDDFDQWIQQTRSRLNRALEQAVGRGPRGLPYLVTEAGLAGERRRGLGVSPRLITLEGGKLDGRNQSA